jgi:predicted DCC family thiol-disulfide oxidoreductase YuxK
MSTGCIVVFDGMCHLCARSVGFTLAHEHDHLIRFAAARSPAGRELLRRHGLEPETVPTLVVIKDGAALLRSAAVLEIASHLRLPWRLLGLLRVLPRRLRDAPYDVIAQNRYRWFGRRDACLLPTPELASRFLDNTPPPP